MAGRDISLTPRAENTREARPIPPPVQFSLPEIRQHFTDSMATIKAQYDVAASLESDGNMEACKTIWRSQVVLAEGLLDFYIHEISKFCLFRMFSGQWDKSEKYKSIRIPMDKVEEAMAAVESNDWFFAYLNDQFSRSVFLSYESMKDQLNLIGVGFKTAMVYSFPEDNEGMSVEYGKDVIQKLFQRRNEIAHQNDRSHANAEQTDITKGFVESYIGDIESIVNAIHKIAEEKDAAFS